MKFFFLLSLPRSVFSCSPLEGKGRNPSKAPPFLHTDHHRSFFHDFLQRFRRNVVSRAAELKQVKGCLVSQEQFFVNKILSRKSGELGALGVMKS
ncbi:hypothetical protein IGI04_015685 [Brassica rapa subsp. trilocularis]|uniref:Secreted protein n=1 Tax=Brassica rapa subsp. trilocularis TaxID=1813537 RepID=A0ABQ7MQT9_BRACM|nr:hypothetical protein IGI04_015685 [Brassica rapa subsp. trilocularis]